MYITAVNAIIMKNKNFINIITRNNQGIALVTVILVIAILGILAAVAIETTGTDIINAGNYTSSEQTLNISNSAMNIVLAQLNTSQQTNAGIGMPSPNVYYYTLSNNNTIQQSPTYIALTTANINSNFSGALGFTTDSGNFGFEYNGTYGGVPGYSLNYHFYNGQVNTITQNQNASKTVQTGMTFSYGPIQVGYNQ
jgi:type II secretory pathway pseudopilin PulG